MKKHSLSILALASLAALAAGNLFGAAAAGTARVYEMLHLKVDNLAAAIDQKMLQTSGSQVLGANVLTNLAADIYVAADRVGRELVGMIPSVTVNAGIERAAKGDTVRSAFTRPATVVEDQAPSMTIPEGTDQTVDSKTATIEKEYSVLIPWTGEDIKHVNNGAGFQTIYGDQILQAMRAISNAIETYLWGKAYKAASRGYGTAGTTPFGSNFNVLPQLRKILVDNGCPFDGQLSVVMDTAAGANLRSLAQLQKANEAGGTELLRQGTLLDLQGFMLKESAGIGLHTAGAGTGYDINAGLLAIGSKVLTLDGGTVNTTGIKAGDMITLAGDTNIYGVGVGLTAVAGDITLNAPGLRKATTDTAELTIGASYTGNVAFHRSAIELAVRPPAMPEGGDAAVDSMMVQDPHSGLVFEIAAYKGYKKAMFDVRCVAGAKAWKEDNIAVLLG